ncbi:MucB/RseB C-terminal domain-containing protein [Reinekea sp.]|jgi:sigma-E factor negative regulatory protein RseB|uniref:MucB/RseB C-terminal domain-containing protein n=1 Tax=Reinekea sp. TaxID=1970455 RepID=UPI002A82692E|nr:MucB/RseB C-terminal domain-containing protein [Reinekea sp.]
MKSYLYLYVLLALVAAAPIQAMEWQWLDAMRQSVQETNYRGDYIHRRGDQTNAFNIVHRFNQGQSVELLRQLDGDMIEILRDGARTVCYFPEGSEAAMTHAVPAAPFSQVAELDLQRIGENYQAHGMGEQRVAGFNARIIDLKGDEWRYSQRFWLETESNLLLQSELIAPSGEILEQFRFTRLEIAVTIEAAELIPSLKDSAVLQQVAFRSPPDVANDTGYRSKLNWLPAGFSLAHAEAHQDSTGIYEQRTYSDGLASFSVFIEGLALPATGQSALAKMGATTALMTSMNGYSVTIIGEIPALSAKKIAQMLSIEGPAL